MQEFGITLACVLPPEVALELGLLVQSHLQNTFGGMTMIGGGSSSASSSAASLLPADKLVLAVVRTLVPVDLLSPSLSGLPPFTTVLIRDTQDQRLVVDVFSNSTVISVTKKRVKNYPSGRCTERDLDRLAGELISIWEESGADGPPAFHPVKDYKIADLDFNEMFAQRTKLASSLKTSKCGSCPKLAQQYQQISKQKRLTRKLQQIQFALSDANLHLMPVSALLLLSRSLFLLLQRVCFCREGFRLVRIMLVFLVRVSCCVHTKMCVSCLRGGGSSLRMIGSFSWMD